jgi:HEAT repeat protein
VEARSYAASELVRLKHPDALVALVETAKKTNPRMQWAAIDALGRLGENTPTETKSTVTAPLVEIMKGDPERTVRERAAMALGPIGDRSVVPALLAALKDPSDFVGAAAAHSLGQLAGPEAIPALEEFAQRASGKSQADAARGAIERIKQRAATP